MCILRKMTREMHYLNFVFSTTYELYPELTLYDNKLNLQWQDISYQMKLRYYEALRNPAE